MEMSGNHEHHRDSFSGKREVNTNPLFRYKQQVCSDHTEPGQSLYILEMKIKFATEGKTWTGKGKIGIEMIVLE